MTNTKIPLKIVEGKFYRTRDGRKVGPIRSVNNITYKWGTVVNGRCLTWTDDGLTWDGGERLSDIIAEWTDEHTRIEGFVVKRLIGPGDGERLWYISTKTEPVKYMRNDGTLHDTMTGCHGTYFKTEDEAESVLQKYAQPLADPKVWADMTPEEKGALLLAELEGKRIEESCAEVGWEWGDPEFGPYWLDGHAYRVRPEPVRGSICLMGGVDNGFDQLGFGGKNTRHLIMPTINGDIPPGIYTSPDGEVIKVERIK